MSLLGHQWKRKDKNLADLVTTQLDGVGVKFHDPFKFKDMQRAVERLEKAMQTNERVLIFGDYDVDGISGTALLVHTLREVGMNVSYRLPTRQDGYGINPKWIDEFASLNIGVLITVDCGISNANEIDLATQKGIDVIITDHHTIPERMPDAYALLHPNLPGDTYPFHELSGSAVAYKLGVALMQHINGVAAGELWRDKLADLACLGTVADCVPLVGENRWIVKAGLDQMKKTDWKGLEILLKKAGVDQIQGHDSDVIGFRIGPRINAAGRLETPYYSLQLLLDENGSANSLADKLETLNALRRTMVEDAMIQAHKQLESRLEDKVLVAWSADWPAGIIGLIAARISEKYHRPAIILEDRGDRLVASCRSPEYFNVVETLTACKDHLLTFGGHAAAAGFTVEKDKFDAFKEALYVHTDNQMEGLNSTPLLSIDYTIELTDLTYSLADSLSRLEPFGQGNIRPRFLIENISPTALQTVGQEHRHLRFQVQDGPRRFSAIAFRFGEHHTVLQEAIFQNKKTVDVVFEVEKNVWRGQERLQLKVVDIGVAEG